MFVNSINLEFEDSDELERTHLLTKKDLYDIEASYNLNNEVVHSSSLFFKSIKYKVGTAIPLVLHFKTAFASVIVCSYIIFNI